MSEAETTAAPEAPAVETAPAAPTLEPTAAPTEDGPSLAKALAVRPEVIAQIEAMGREDLETRLAEHRAAAKPNAMTALLIAECERVLATK